VIKKIKAIFLDFDGVLNFSEFIYKKDSEYLENLKRIELDYMARELSSKRIQLLNQVVERFDNVFFIISSAWRKRASMKKLQAIFELHGFKGEFIDVTPSFGKRGEEIQEWLDTRPEQLGLVIEKFLILDDEPCDMVHLTPYVIQPHPEFWGTGLEQIHIDEIIKRLS
jgi:hypothetical protein